MKENSRARCSHLSGSSNTLHHLLYIQNVIQLFVITNASPEMEWIFFSNKKMTAHGYLKWSRILKLHTIHIQSQTTSTLVGQQYIYKTAGEGSVNYMKDDDDIRRGILEYLQIVV
jgi:hypothetical protein